jgi:hypothetical protein
MPEAMMRRWVGHVDAEILKVYAHTADRDSRKFMQRLGESLTGQQHVQKGAETRTEK